MKTIQKKMLVQVLLGFLLGRVSIYGMNPVAPAFFAAGFAEGGAVLPVAITILLGMSTVFALDTVLAYGAGMLAGCRLFEKAEDNGKDGTCRLFVGSGNMGHVGNKVFACSV